MISRLSSFLGLMLVVFAPIVEASSSICGNSGFEKLPTGWLMSPTAKEGTFYFKTTRKLLEPPPITSPSVLGPLARDAAVRAILNRYKRIKPPPVENASIVVKGMQSMEVRCADGDFLLYQVDMADLSWGPVENAEDPRNDSMKLLRKIQSTFED